MCCVLSPCVTMSSRNIQTIPGQGNAVHTDDASSPHTESITLPVFGILDARDLETGMS